MSRPKSEDKRRAILDGALRVFAERGISDSPTSAISRAAGVAEGTLFTYFKTKDELMNALYLEMRQEFSRYLPQYPIEGDAQTRMRYIWDKYLEIGAAHPERLRVLAQLRSSGKMFKENEPPAAAILELLNAARDSAQGSELQTAPPEYLALLVRAQAETTIEFIRVHPEQAEDCREWGFSMLWKGFRGV